MTQLTVRGLDDELYAALKVAAGRQGMSMNRFVVRVLGESVGYYDVKRQATSHDDLDALFGTWSSEAGIEFERSLADQRRVDDALWR